MKRSKYELAVANSKRKGTHLFHRVLFPRPKGVWSSIQGLKSNLNAVYDVTIAFASQPPSVIEFYCRGNFTVKLYIKRYELSKIPVTERDFNQWMQERFLEKDEWLAKNSGWDLNFSNK